LKSKLFDSFSKINIFSSINNINQIQKFSINENFNEIIENFCEILVLYRELFVKTSEKSDQADPNPQKSQILLKSLLNPENQNQFIDIQKMEILCKKILHKSFKIKSLESDKLLKNALKEQIEKLSQFITFFFEEMKVFHGEISHYHDQGEGHLLDISENFEYFGRFKNRQLQGKGQKWIPSVFSIEGHFEKGLVCGYAQKIYDDGSLYR
jgi:hypothetical protein